MKINIEGVTRNMLALWFEENSIRFIDQRKLPYSLAFYDARTVEETAFAIKDMVVRGAPAIGVAGAYGMAIASITGIPVSEVEEEETEKLLRM